MKKWSVSFLLVAVLLLLNLAGNITTVNAFDRPPDFPAERFLLKFIPDTPDIIISDIFTRYNIEEIEKIEPLDVHVVTINDRKTRDIIRNLSHEDNIEYVEPDIMAMADVVPNDIFYSYQWGLKQINASQAWDITRGSTSVKIAICDTGIDLNHPDLTERIVAVINFTDSNTSDDKNGHGTHIAGIAGAITNNKTGIAGTCSIASLMNIKVLGDNGIGYYSWVTRGIIWAADNGARVINLSLSGGWPSLTLEHAVDYAWNKNCVIVASAGNNRAGNASYPAFYSNCMAVAATDKEDNRADFSNYGYWVDIAAPGVDIYSTLPNHSNNTPYLNYGCLSGTSVAAPFTSGVAALVWSTHYGNSCQSVVNQIINGGDKSGSIWSEYGIKRLNALNSVK